MKKRFKYFLLVLAFIKFGCTEPTPTEIYVPEVPSDAQVDIEVLSPEPDLYVYQNGYDSIGYVAPTPTNKTIINLSGIRNTYKQYTVKRTSAFALFIDESVKATTPDGRTIGYLSRLIGKVSFNNVKAIPLPRIVKYKWNGTVQDTLLGWIHYFSQKYGTSPLFPFPYNSSVKFRLVQFMEENVIIDIPTPEEIIGNVLVQGSVRNKDLKITLKWNPTHVGNIALVVGGMNPNDFSPFPLYRIRVKDTGEVNIPRSLLKTFPFNRFKQMVISFVRQRFVGDPLSGDQIIVAQSIHNIKIDVP